MDVRETGLTGLFLLEPSCFSDDRGFFWESFQRRRYADFGIFDDFVQDNHSRSRRGVLRGMHFQVMRPQAQIVSVMRGSVFDVVVDLRRSSPTFSRWYGVVLSDDGPRQIYMAPGFAHGFYVLSDYVDLHYKVSRYYVEGDEGGLAWNDPDIGITWPVQAPELSPRDASYPRFKDLGPAKLPHDPAVELQPRANIHDNR